MIFQPLTSNQSTFENTFVTRAVTLHVSELLALCNFSKKTGYTQPNVNHHFINENSSFDDLNKAFKAAIKGETTVSTEYDAVLCRIDEKKSDSVELQLPTYNVVTEEKAEEVVVVVDTRVFDGFVTKLPSLKEKVSCFKKEKVQVEGDKDLEKEGFEGAAGANVMGEDGNVVDGKEVDVTAVEDGAANVETVVETGYTKSFLLFIEEMRTMNEGLCLSFLDGLHRSYSLVSFASKSEENFQAVLSSAMNVTINFYVLKPDKTSIPEEPRLSEIEADLQWFQNMFAFTMEDIEIVLALTQDKSGTLMLAKKATVGHTILDAYSVLSRSVRNNNVNVYFSSSTYQVEIRKTKTWKHVLLDYNTGKDNHLHLEDLTTKLFVEKFFKNFFFNNGFEEWAKQGLPMKLRRDLIKEDGRYNIETLFSGFFSNSKWEILLTLKVDLRSIHTIIVEKRPVGNGRNNKLFCGTRIATANMLLLSLARLFLLTPTIRETAHTNMTSLQHRGFLSKERLVFLTGIADHNAGLLLNFYSEHFGKRTEEVQIPLKCILRTNFENLLLSLYSKDIVDGLLCENFRIPYELPDVPPLEYSVLSSLWEVHDKLNKTMSHKMMFLDGLAFAYGRYLLYFLIICPFFAHDMLPVLWTFLNPKKTKDKKSKEISKKARNKKTNMNDYHGEFEINTAFSLLKKAKQIKDDFVLSSISAKEFIQGCLNLKEDGVPSKSELSNDDWNPLYPVPFIRQMLQLLNEHNEFESQPQHYKLIMDTLQKYHEEDSAFVKDIKSPSKPKRKRGTPTTASSPKHKKNRTVILYDSSEDEGMDMERMDEEYAFVGIPLQKHIENETNSNLQDEKDQSNIEAPSEDVPEHNSVSSQQDLAEMAMEEADVVEDQEKESNNDETYVETNDDNSVTEPRRSARLASTKKQNDDEEIVEKEENKKKKINLAKDREYLFFKAYRTYNFLSPESDHDRLQDFTTVAEIACKLYWLNNLQGKSRKDMLDNHFHIMVDAYAQGEAVVSPKQPQMDSEESYGTEQILKKPESQNAKDGSETQGQKNSDTEINEENSETEQGQKNSDTEINEENSESEISEDATDTDLDICLSIMGTALNNHSKSALGQLFHRARDDDIELRATSFELLSIFKKFGLCPTPFSTDITFPGEYQDGVFELGKHVRKVTFLDPFEEEEKKIQITSELDEETLTGILLETFGNIETGKPTLTITPSRSEKEYLFEIKDCPSFYEKLLFIENDVVAHKNLVRTKKGSLRVEFFHEKNAFFLENLSYDLIFRVIDEKGKVYVAPYDRERNYPMYQDYFQIDPPIDVDALPKGYGTDITSIVAKILGVSEANIIEKENVPHQSEWFCCLDRYSLLNSLLLGETFSPISTIDSDEEAQHLHSDNDEESVSESEKNTDNGRVQNETISKRVTRSTKKDNHGRFQQEGIFYYFTIGQQKHYIKFAKVSMNERPLYYWFDKQIYTIEDFNNAHMTTS